MPKSNQSRSAAFPGKQNPADVRGDMRLQGGLMNYGNSMSTQTYYAAQIAGAAAASGVAVIREGLEPGLQVSPFPGTIAKEGQDLVFTFEDGGMVVLQGYYKYF